MQTITSTNELEEIYGAPVPQSLTKVTSHLTPLYRDWIGAARFLVLSTIGPEGTDASPRGDDGPVVHMADSRTLWLPDWRGNNRIDSLRNIVRDPRVSLMFMVPGCNNVVRVNGTAVLTADEENARAFRPQIPAARHCGGDHHRRALFPMRQGADALPPVGPGGRPPRGAHRRPVPEGTGSRISRPGPMTLAMRNMRKVKDVVRRRCRLRGRRARLMHAADAFSCRSNTLRLARPFAACAKWLR